MNKYYNQLLFYPTEIFKILSQNLKSMAIFSPSLSVLLPSYKRPVELIKCLRAVEDQNLKPDQVIVIARTEDLETLRVLSMNLLLNQKLFVSG